MVYGLLPSIQVTNTRPLITVSVPTASVLKVIVLINSTEPSITSPAGHDAKVNPKSLKQYTLVEGMGQGAVTQARSAISCQPLACSQSFSKAIPSSAYFAATLARADSPEFDIALVANWITATSPTAATLAPIITSTMPIPFNNRLLIYSVYHSRYQSTKPDLVTENDWGK